MVLTDWEYKIQIVNSLLKMSMNQNSRAPQRDRFLPTKSDPTKHTSPLRLKKPPSHYQHQEDEEEEYERRREEELKRQIKQKEAEIQNLAKASDYLRQKLDNSVTMTNRQQPIADSRYASFGRQMPERGPFDQEGSFENDNPPPHQIREHISNLQSDNASLMRRLNLVLQELDRVQKEKEEIQNRLQQSSKEAMNIQRLINGEDNQDKVNRYMQEDLSYEQERNQKLRNQIKEQDEYQKELLKELKAIQDKQDEVVHKNQVQDQDLGRKVNNMQELEREIYFAKEKIKQLSNAIELGKREEMMDHGEKTDLQRVVNQLLHERNELMQKLDNLTGRYDDCVRDIGQDRMEMERHNKQHSKLVTAKIIFQELELLLKNKEKQGMEEIKIYCLFDTKCHDKLQKFAKAMDFSGKYLQRIAIKKWFQNCLKPLETKQQSKEIAKNIYRTTLLGKKFALWKTKYNKIIDSYDLKTKSIQQIWKFRLQDAKIELKRALAIWRGCLHKSQKQTANLKKLIYSMYFKKLSLAMNTWKNHDSNLDLQVRLSLLSQQFTHKQYLNLLFNSFKYQSLENKRKKHNKLFHYMKYWKDYINYRKFLMGAQIQALHLQKSYHTSLVKSCFDALKQSKEEEKYQKLHAELNEIERPLIQELDQHIQVTSEERLQKIKTLAGNCFCRQINKTIYQSFDKWRKIVADKREVVKGKITGRLQKAYNDMTRMAFNKWKISLQSGLIQQHQTVVLEQQEEQKVLIESVVQVKKEVQEKSEMKDQSGQRHLNKCLQKYLNRIYRLAMDKWRAKIHEINTKEGGAHHVIQRIRCRLLRQAFDLYSDGVKYKRKVQNDVERCKFYNKTRSERLLSLIFAQWKIFKNNHKTAKKYWYRIYLRLDQNMMAKGFSKWKEGAKRHAINELEHVERTKMDDVAELNHQIGEITTVEESQQQEIKTMKNSLTRQSQRVLANAFAKYYYVGQTRGFEKWKEYVSFEKHKEYLIKKMLDHWKAHQFYFVKSALKNWILFANINERKDQIKKEEQKISDTQFAYDLQTEEFSEKNEQLNQTLDEVQKIQKRTEKQIDQTVKMVTRKVGQNYYTSNKRFILQTWHQYVKGEKMFIRSIQNVIQKSLWTYGFVQIKNFSRADQKQETQETTLEKFRKKFWKRTCGNAFSNWRSGAFTTTKTDIKEAQQQFDKKMEVHNDKVAERKLNNQNKVVKVMGKQHLKNLLLGWKNVTKLRKRLRTKTIEYKEATGFYAKRNTLRKWKCRKDRTDLEHMRLTRLKQKFTYLRKLLVFQAMKERFQASKDFVSRVANLANIHDQQAIKMGYNAIISFARAKKYVQERKKEVATIDMVSFLNNIVLRRKVQYFRDLQYRTLAEYRNTITKGFTVFHNIMNKMRNYFLRWKTTSEKMQLAQEMHDEGPVREQIFEDRIQLKNIQNFMKEEGYDTMDTKDALKKGSVIQNELMMKTIRRLQHNNLPLYTKPKMFDKWKMFVHMRKLYRYWLQFVNNRSQYIKCDVAVAFARWKKYDVNQKEALKKLSKDELDQRVVKNAGVLGTLADQIQDKEEEIKHLNDQRDELVENYIKGQRLALALWQNNLLRSKHRAFMRWSKNAKGLRNLQSDMALRMNVELIASLKDKIRQLEKENDDYGNENEELRQFSLDGYEIAKNVQQLSGEREKLSVDLADKAQTIKRLLDENEKLNSRLKMAQSEAQSLIKNTSKYMGNSQSSNGGGGTIPFASPMMRGSEY